MSYLKEKMKVVLVEPGEYARITEIEDTLEAEQQAVGGSITFMYPWAEPVCIVCNDEGYVKGMPLNRFVEGYHVVAGPFFICGMAEENFCGLTDEQAERYRQMFLRPEMYLHDGEKFNRIQYDNPQLAGAPEEAAQRIEKRGGLPDLCFAAPRIVRGVIMLQYGVNGYFPVRLQPGYKRRRECVDALNEKLGVSRAQALAMLCGSMYGWDESLSPSQFDENGEPKPSHPKQTKSKAQEER